MNKTIFNQNTSKMLEKIKWFFILTCFILSYFINYYFYTIEFFIRMSLISFFIICAIGTLSCTKKAKYIFSYIKESKKEMQKMTWPGYKETLYTALIVIFVTIFISLILWSLDSIIFHLIAFIISLRF